jgi:dihydropteroate synthase
MGRHPAIRFRTVTLAFDRPLLAGVLNLTPDSFSDGGRHASVEAAVACALRMVADGADLLDLGGESTRPRAATVPVDEELRRVVPVLEALRGRVSVPLSIDTTKAAVAAAALHAGAEIVNDISGGRFDPDLVAVADRAGAALILGHVRGDDLGAVHAGETTPPSFAEIVDDLRARLAALPAGLRARTMVDPGVGFGKSLAGNLELLARAGELGAALGRPVMVGPSRKRFLGELTGRPVCARDDATVGAALAAVAAGADLVRVHDVARVHDALVVFTAIRGVRP